MRRMWTRALLLGAIGLACGSVVGCAQERPPINQVQADALAKSFFVGPNLADVTNSPEFYMRGTIVDVGYGAAQDGLFTSTYAQPISRVRWEITEGYLNARLSYERVANSDGKGNQTDGLVKKKTNDGQIVASYKISSHFDIRRSYNPTTGEELNVVVENSTDRPWYQREYFRVDWSQNLATDSYDYDTLTSLGWIGAIQYEPLSYTVLSPNDPDAPHFDSAAGYFDVTNKAFAKPALIDLSSLGWGINQIPACMLPGDFAGGTAPYGDCNPVEITLRQSFRKVVDKDYEPKDYDGYRFQAFGIFTTERTGYSRDYGMVDNQWHHFADRYNIWDRSHYYTDPTGMTGEVACNTLATTVNAGDPGAGPAGDPNRDLNGDGTADECQAVTDATKVGGSQCDVFTHKCTLPYAKRTPVTIPWYINGGDTVTINSLNDQITAATDPAQKSSLQQELAAEIKKGEDLFEATNWAVQEWDLALKSAVQTARLTECYRTAPPDKTLGPDGTMWTHAQFLAACQTSFPMWVGQQEDNDEAVNMSRDLDVCRRQAAIGSTDPATNVDSDTLEAARKAGWSSAACASAVQAATTALAKQRANPADASAAAMAKIIPADPVIVLCHNPVIESDHPACGALGLSPRLGDIRYNTVLNIDKPQAPSAWGIMVDADDPLTGEKVAASINIWTHITDVASQSLVDLVRYMNGELKTGDITDGKYIDDWAKAAQIGADGSGPPMSKRQINQRLAAVAGVDTPTYETSIKAGLPAGMQQAVRQFRDSKVADIAVSRDVASHAAYGVAARMRAMHGSATEATLLNQPILQLAGVNGTVPQGTALDQASPMALNNPRVTSQLNQMRQAAMAARGACILEEAPETSSLTGIAKAMLRKFPKGAAESAIDTKNRYDAMLGYIRRRYHYAVLAHEMGHSVGLRHNFVSSFASLHYRPQYWQLRTANGAQVTPCTDAVTDGSTCTGPRYWDPLTEEEQSQMIWMFMQSTVMDYPGDVSQDTIGLGAYDFAAARMFYGDVTSIYNVQKGGKLDPAFLSNAGLGQAMVSVTDNFGGLVGIKYNDATGNNIHYSQLQANYNLISNCQPVTPAAPGWWRPEVDGVWDPLFDGKIVSIGGKATKCRSLPVDYANWDALRVPNSSEGGGVNYRGGNAVDNATKRVRVPYSFASDNWADTGNTSVFRHDNGADPYEQTMFLITTQENRHILDNFRRGRNTFNVRAAADRSYSRYNEKLLGISGGVGFLGNIYKDFATGNQWTWDTLWPVIIDQSFRDNMIGATLAFDHFTRELSRPESGPHYFLPTAPVSDAVVPAYLQDNTLRSISDSDGNAGTTALVVPEGSTGYLGIEMKPNTIGTIGFGGHILENGLATDKGDYDVDYPINSGAYYPKIHTAHLLSLSEDRFISQSRQDFYDARFRAVGMADVLPDGWRRVIANALTGDRSLMAAHVTADANGNPLLSGKVDPYDPKNTTTKQYPHDPMGWTSWWPSEGPTMCFPSNGSNVCASYNDGSSVPGLTPNGFKPITEMTTTAIDPQIGWEVQKFMIAWTLAYIPANQQAVWVDMMRIYKLGLNADPAFNDRIEWQDPISESIYYAKSYGHECLFGPSTATDKASCEAVTDPFGVPTGHWVEKGIAARVLEYANQVTSYAYAADPAYAATNGFNPKGRFMVARMSDNTPVVRFDPTMHTVAPVPGSPGMIQISPTPGTCDTDVPAASYDCDATNSDTTTAGTAGVPNPAGFCGAIQLRSKGCTTPLTKWDNHWAVELDAYKSVPDYLWEVMVTYQLADDKQLGLFP